MRHVHGFVVGSLAGAFTLGLASCGLDDSAPVGGGGSGGTVDGSAGSGGRGGSPSSTTNGGGGASKDGAAGTGGLATGGAPGTGGAAGNAAGTGGATGPGGSAGAGGTGGAGGDAGSGGAGGDGGMSIDAGQDTGPPCTREPDTIFCSRQRKNCGDFNAVDNCGAPYKTNCGICVDQTICGGSGTLNVCGGDTPINRAQGGTITASIATDVKVTEDRTKPFDNNVNTKWFVNASATPWIAYQFPAGAAYAITVYTVTSANDMPGRDPTAWRLEGTNDPTLTSWTVLDTRANETFASRFQTNTYVFPNATAYIAYRFFVTANGGVNRQCQFAELQLFDIPGAVGDGGARDSASEAQSDAGATTDASLDAGGDGDDGGGDAASADSPVIDGTNGDEADAGSSGDGAD